MLGILSIVFVHILPYSETANVSMFITSPSTPSYAEEGKNFTLKWTYILDGTVGFAQFSIDNAGTDLLIGKKFGPGVIPVQPKYQSRFRAQVTDTRAELNILSVQRSDEKTYKLNVVPTGSGTLGQSVLLDVSFQSSIKEIFGNQTVTEGGNVTLKCLAYGKPMPNITWTRLSGNRVVNMMLTDISRQDAGKYRCTADNGIGNPAYGDVWITVQYQPNLTFISVNQTVNDSDLVQLNCTADGFPTPKITLTRLSPYRDVGMSFKVKGKQDEGYYRCTADNGIGNPATADVFVTVQFYGPFNTGFSTNLTNEASLNETFYLMCSAEANPAAGYRLYKEDESVANITAGSQNIGLYATSVGDRIKHVVYKCIPFNSFGDGPTKTLNITVYYHVEATGYGANYTVAKGGGQNMTCPVDGNPKPSIKWYKGSKASGNPESTKNVFTVKGITESVCYTCVANNSLGKPVSISQCVIVVDSTLAMVSPTTLLQQNKSAPSITKPTGSGPEGLAGPPWTFIGAATGSVVGLAIVVGVLTWWVHKQRKCKKDTKIHNSDQRRHGGEVVCSQVQGAYAQSGPPAANGTDSAAEQQTEAEASIPTYAVVDKSKKSKKQADERPPEYAVVNKSQKKEKQEVAATPTYAAVDKSKKKKKSREEVPAVYAEVDKSKKKKKKKIDDKNLYENLDEPKKEKKPGELLYADLGDFQNPGMPAVSISPQPLPAIKKADPYEGTDYADITQFLKGNATLPPNDGNGDAEMKPKRPSKKKEIQGNDKETPI